MSFKHPRALQRVHRYQLLLLRANQSGTQKESRVKGVFRERPAHCESSRGSSGTVWVEILGQRDGVEVWEDGDCPGDADYEAW